LQQLPQLEVVQVLELIVVVLQVAQVAVLDEILQLHEQVVLEQQDKALGVVMEQVAVDNTMQQAVVAVLEQ
jgi:hypothetical protein